MLMSTNAFLSVMLQSASEQWISKIHNSNFNWRKFYWRFRIMSFYRTSGPKTEFWGWKLNWLSLSNVLRPSNSLYEVWVGREGYFQPLLQHTHVTFHLYFENLPDGGCLMRHYEYKKYLSSLHLSTFCSVFWVSPDDEETFCLYEDMKKAI